MARAAEQNARLVNDYIAAFNAANPNREYEVEVSYITGGWVEITQNGYRSKYRPSKIEAMTKTLRDRASF